MVKFTVRKGIEANLPTEGMAEEGCVYHTTDTGNAYLGGANGNLIPLNRSPYYGTCPTAAGTAAKVVTLDSEVFSLSAGTMIAVRFDNANTVTPTLNVNGTGAVAVKSYGTTAVGTTPTGSWHAGEVVNFVYDGSYWMRIGGERCEDGAQVNVQSDWKQSDTAADDYIKNKPTVPTLVDKVISYAPTGAVTAGWRRVCTFSNFGSYIVFMDGSWSGNSASHAGVSITINYTSAYIKQLWGYSASSSSFGGIDQLRLVRVYEDGEWKSKWKFEFHHKATSSRPGIRRFRIIGDSGVSNPIIDVDESFALVEDQTVPSGVPYWLIDLVAMLRTPAIKVNLASEDDGLFDGTNINTAAKAPGVLGTLPVAHGGTGNTSVDTTPTASSTKMVTSGGVHSALELKAPLASPSLTGVPTAPTAAVGTDTTQIATTAFVQAAVPTTVAELSDASNYALDANVVHKTGDETVGGNKTFTSDATFANRIVAEDEVFLSDGAYNQGYAYVRMHVSQVTTVIGSDTVTKPVIFFERPDGASISPVSIRGIEVFGANDSAVNKKYVDDAVSGVASTIPDVSNYALDANVVHKTGEEMIAGAKSFSNLVNINNGISINNSQGIVELTSQSTNDGQVLRLLDGDSENVKIVGVATPTVGNHAANKKYVDDSIRDIDAVSEDDPRLYDGYEIASQLTFSVARNSYIDRATKDWAWSTTYKHFVIPANGIRKIVVTANSQNPAYISFLKNYVLGTSSSDNTTSDYAGDYTCAIRVMYGETMEFAVPSDAEEIYISAGSSSDPTVPSSVKLTGLAITRANEDVIDNSMDAVTSDALYDDIVIAGYRQHEMLQYVISNSMLIKNAISASTLKWISSTSRHLRFRIPKHLVSVDVTANANYLTRVAFLTGEEATGGNTPSFVTGTSLTLVAAGETVKFAIPSGALYMYVLAGAPDNYNNIPSSIKGTGDRPTENMPLFIGNKIYDGSETVEIGSTKTYNAFSGANISYLRSDSGHKQTLIYDTSLSPLLGGAWIDDDVHSDEGGFLFDSGKWNIDIDTMVTVNDSVAKITASVRVNLYKMVSGTATTVGELVIGREKVVKPFTNNVEEWTDQIVINSAFLTGDGSDFFLRVYLDTDREYNTGVSTDETLIQSQVQLRLSRACDSSYSTAFPIIPAV